MVAAPDLDTPNIPISQAAKVAKTELATTRWWFAKSVILLGQHDRPPAFPGDTQFLTARRVLQLAIGAALTPMMTPRRAFDAARNFTDGFEHGEPGRLHPDRPTLLITDPTTGVALVGWPGDRLKEVQEAFSANPLLMLQLD